LNSSSFLGTPLNSNEDQLFADSAAATQRQELFQQLGIESPSLGSAVSSIDPLAGISQIKPASAGSCPR